MEDRALTPRPVQEALDALASARQEREAAAARTDAILRRLPDSPAVAEALDLPHGRADVYHAARRLFEVTAVRPADDQR